MPVSKVWVLLLPGVLNTTGQAIQDARPTTAEVTSAIQQPAKDIGLVRDVLPASVRKAADAPYDVKSVGTCAAIGTELGDLDKDLGPDVDKPSPHSETRGLAGDLIRGALSLPFNSLVRRVSGAARREEAYRKAVAAGMVRRGFLKGRASALNCP